MAVLGARAQHHFDGPAPPDGWRRPSGFAYCSSGKTWVTILSTGRGRRWSRAWVTWKVWHACPSQVSLP